MKYRLVQSVDGRMIATELTDHNIIPAMEVRGFALNGLNDNPHHRIELQGQPKFSGVLGPMWDGDTIRYEDSETYRALSI